MKNKLISTCFAGMIASTNPAEVCSLDYAHRHRSHLTQETRRAEFAKAGVDWADRANYELDHIVPLCLGGADTPENRTPQPLAEALAKDAVEKFACKAVCNEHTMSLEKAQSIFLDDQWRAWRE